MWKNEIDHYCNKLSNVCDMVCKLRYYVPLSTVKLVYYSLFHFNIQHFLLNWDRAAKKVIFTTLESFKTNFISYLVL